MQQTVEEFCAFTLIPTITSNAYDREFFFSTQMSGALTVMMLNSFVLGSVSSLGQVHSQSPDFRTVLWSKTDQFPSKWICLLETV